MQSGMSSRGPSRPEQLEGWSRIAPGAAAAALRRGGAEPGGPPPQPAARMRHAPCPLPERTCWTSATRPNMSMSPPQNAWGNNKMTCSERMGQARAGRRGWAGVQAGACNRARQAAPRCKPCRAVRLECEGRRQGGASGTRQPQAARLVHAAEADALDGAALAGRQRRPEAQRVGALQHTQRHGDHHSICLEAVCVGLDFHP